MNRKRWLIAALAGALAAALPALAARDAQVTPHSAFEGALPGAPSGAPADYRIGPLDKLDITVFEVKDLTLTKLQVDAAGQILLPLIGAIRAQGKTTTEVSAEIAARLGAKYLQDPQVSVVVEDAVSQKVSVEGAVNEAGVFPLKGRTSLLEAVALAKGCAKGANLHRVAIVRTVDGQERAATFDLAAIRLGKAPDPEVLGDDVVYVDSSKPKVLWRGMIEALPALIVFSYL